MAGTVAGCHRSSAPPAQGACGRVDRRRLLPAFVRSSGDHRGIALSAGAAGGPEAGVGEDELSGDLQLEQEDRELASGRWESNRGGRGSGGGEELPVFASGACSRPQQSRSWPAMAVRLQRWPPVARRGWVFLRTIFWSSSDDRTKLLQLERKIGVCGLSESSRRWGALSAARPAKRSLPRGCWEAGEATWMTGRVFWRARREFGSGVRSGSEDGPGVCCGI